MIDDLVAQLRRDEGEVLHAYQDSLGYWTIGVGRLIDKRKGGGISQEESAMLLERDIHEKTRQLQEQIPWTVALDPVRRGALVNMAFQLGIGGLLGFAHTLADIKAGRLAEAHARMLASKWAKQTPARARRIADQLLTGEWQ